MCIDVTSIHQLVYDWLEVRHVCIDVTSIHQLVYDWLEVRHVCIDVTSMPTQDSEKHLVAILKYV